jgi:fused signal recognition particle receptor
MEILKHLRDLGRTLKTEDVLTECRKRVLTVLPENRCTALPPLENGQPRVILVAGVNGTGKTTSIAKLAHLLNREGHKVVLAAADTFRAAAIEQLDHWATKIGVPLIKTQYQGDPSAVCYDAYEAAIKRGATHLICDTAGRLHVRANLMEELKKIERTLGKKDATAPHDRLIVVDATTGSNALAQAREFNSALNLTGLILTKLDGSGKGGMAVAIQHQLGIPTLFLGTGERAEDFQRFDRNRFVEELL